MPQWTPQQEAAIKARNPRVLVSAAAGSGKTSVLVARVLDMLREGISLDRMLILTFTKAAAGEMRSRLQDKLGEEAVNNPALKQQLYLVDRADISTLHSFCKKLVQRYFHAAGTDPNSRVADEQVAKRLFDEALDGCLNDLYENPGEDGKNLIDRFREQEIIQIVDSLHNFLMSQADPWGWLAASMDYPTGTDFLRHPWARVMRREALLGLEGALGLVLEAEAISLLPDGPARYLDALQDDKTLIENYLKTLGEEDSYPGPLPGFTSLSTRKKNEEDKALAAQAKALRDEAKAAVGKALALLPEDQTMAEAWAREMALTLPALRALSRLTRDVHERYQQMKAEKTLWDYHDLEHFALKALMVPEIAQEAAGGYDALFIDEYQDISHIQEAVIRKLHDSRNSLFMVGDVKQSIYRFRLADPSLFLAHYHAFDRTEKEDERMIPLKENFRSQPNVLHAVNLVFENTMRETVTEISYEEEARLVPGRTGSQGEPVELWLINRGDEGPAPLPVSEEEQEETGEEEAVIDSAFDYEARLIARRILALRNETIPDKEGVPQPIRYRDIAVLLRSSVRRAASLARILGEAGIPAYSDTDDGFFNLPEVRDVINLLKVLDNPYDDETLLAALASHAFRFTPAELTDIRKHQMDPGVPLHRNFFEMADHHPRVRDAAQRFARWRFLAENMPLERFVRHLLRDSGVYTLAGARPDGELRRANLRLLATMAAPSPDPQSLHSFLKRLEHAGKQGSRRSASLGEQEDVVRVMTLHKSKGLEFPVVIMPDLASQFSRKKQRLPLLADAETGLALTLVVPEAKMKKKTFSTRAMTMKKDREERSEEARLLYVGMTRARERLILMASHTDLDRELARWGRPQSDFVVGSAGSMLDWIGACLHEGIARGHDSLFELAGSRFMIYHTGVGGLVSSAAIQEAQVQELPLGRPGAAIQALMEEAAPPPPPPPKNSVTALVTGRLGLVMEEEEETPDSKRREMILPLPLAPLPRLQDDKPLSAAQRGIATHRALGALDPRAFTELSGEALSEAITAALEGLLSRGILRSQERQALDEQALAAWFESDLAKRLAASPECHREWPFTLKVEGGMLLQGVLDACFLEDGAWVLVDYKTDRDEAEALRQKYTDQMRWYSRALREITGIPVKEAWLYLLQHKRAVQVTENRPIRLAQTL